MSRNKWAFLFMEILLAIATLYFFGRLLADETPKQRVAVIVENSGDDKWDGFINGLKQAAKVDNIHLIICNTGDIDNSQEEYELIKEQIDNDVDGFIIQPAPGMTAENFSILIDRKVPFVITASNIVDEDSSVMDGAIYSKVMPDNQGAGESLAQKIIDANGGRLTGKSIGIVLGTYDSESAQLRRKGFEDRVKEYGAELSWCVNTGGESDIERIISSQKKVDIIAAMETKSLESLGEARKNGGTYRAYGIGSSIGAIRMYDRGIIDDIIILDGFDMGYKSLTEISGNLSSRVYKRNDITSDIVSIDRKHLFDKENEDFLYSFNR